MTERLADLCRSRTEGPWVLPAAAAGEAQAVARIQSALAVNALRNMQVSSSQASPSWIEMQAEALFAYDPHQLKLIYTKIGALQESNPYLDTLRHVAEKLLFPPTVDPLLPPWSWEEGLSVSPLAANKLAVRRLRDPRITLNHIESSIAAQGAALKALRFQETVIDESALRPWIDKICELPPWIVALLIELSRKISDELVQQWQEACCTLVEQAADPRDIVYPIYAALSPHWVTP